MNMKHQEKQNYNLVLLGILTLVLSFTLACNKKKKSAVGSQRDDCEVLRNIKMNYCQSVLEIKDTLRLRMPVYLDELSSPPCIQMIDWIYNSDEDFEIIGVITDKSNLDKQNSVSLRVLKFNNPNVSLLIPEFKAQDTVDLNLYGYDVKRLGKFIF